jgi:hypothetical protein
MQVGGDFRADTYTQTAAVVGIQLTGTTQIGTFIQVIGAALDEGPEPDQLKVDEQPRFQAARHEAQRMFEAGRIENASRAFMDAFEQEERVERERQEDRRRFRLRLLEEALDYDIRALNADRVLNGDAAFAKLRLIAEVMHPGDRNAQVKYLQDRAAEYQGRGQYKADKSALHIAVSAFSWLLKDIKDVERR